MKQTEILDSLITECDKFCKFPRGPGLTIPERMLYGVLYTDIFMAKQALLKNSQPMIEYYIAKLQLHIGEPYASKENQING